jgi:hypothetical protein
MTAQNELEHAADLLERLLPGTTAAPWVDGTVDGNRYAALVHTGCSRDCDDRHQRWIERHPEHDHTHPHDGYGGCLVAESMHPEDRRLLAVLRNVADDLAPMLRALAHEDPIEGARLARRIGRAVVDTHRPRGDER